MHFSNTFQWRCDTHTTSVCLSAAIYFMLLFFVLSFLLQKLMSLFSYIVSPGFYRRQMNICEILYVFFLLHWKFCIKVQHEPWKEQEFLQLIQEMSQLDYMSGNNDHIPADNEEDGKGKPITIFPSIYHLIKETYVGNRI